MARKLKNPDDIKVFILYLLKNLGRPLTFNEAADVASQDDLIGYMDFAECLSDLVDTQNVVIKGEGDEQFYEITEQGKQVAESLQSNISGFIRTKSLQSALRYLSFKDRDVRTPVTSTPRGDGGYDMVFRLTEKGKVLFELSLIAENEYMEQQMRHGFHSDPERIYRSILSLVSGDTGYLFE